MMKKTGAVGIVLLIMITFFPILILAASQIDTSFGQEGYSLQDFKIGDDEAFAIAVQDDGKILVAGYSSNGAVKDLIVSRFSADGTLDADFNAAGIFSKSLGNGDTIGRSLIVQEDGNIIISGSTFDGTAKVVVLRLTSEGYLDTSFASDGYVMLSVNDGEIVDTDAQLTDSGSIVVSATIDPETASSYAYFAKYDTEGQLDPSFGTDGQTSYKDDTNDVRMNSITVLSDGKILAGGSFGEGTVAQAGLLQLNTDGTIDTSYADDGKAALSLDGTSSVINSIVPDSDGNVIVAGAVNNGEYDEAFVGVINADGTAKSDFGTSGIYKTTYSQENVIYAVSLRDDNSISAVGFISSATGKDMFVLGLAENAETQTTAATYTVTDIAENDDVAYATAALENNLILAAGSSFSGEDLDVALLRFSEDLTLSSYTATGSTTGITTSGFLITTDSVTAITRVSAVSGGTITNKNSGTCAETCTSECEDSDDDTCYTTCISTCEDDLTVTTRGVVYGTDPNPTYTESDTEEESTTDSDTTSSDSTSTDSDTTTSSSIFSDSSSTGNIFSDSTNSYIVRLGSTDDGDGDGSYTSNVTDITPGTKYFLRAYAVLSNGEVIYGNQYTFTTDDACFIATAAYGSILEKHVVLLRQFRDSYLLTSDAGQRFVALYYHFSPPIADIIRDNELLQAIVRIALLPAVLLALFFVKTTFITQILCLIAGLICTLLFSFKYLTSHQVTTT